MKSIITIIFFLGSVSAQTSPFNSYDVVLYPEYYFDGLMAEVDGEVNTEYLPLSFEMSVPENADSVFFVSGSASSEAEVNYLSILNRNNQSFVEVSILESKFRIFIFYDLKKNGDNRSGSFDFEINHSLDDAHIIVQEPLVAEGFTFSEKDAETFQDQHGMNFQRVHIHDFKANARKSVSFSYLNPTGEISINKLQTMLSNDDRVVTPQITPNTKIPPLRHKLPLWQPLAVLGVITIMVGWMFSVQKKKERVDGTQSKPIIENGTFCTHCGHSLLSEHKFCANCGGQR
jgi:hypothetical protein|tara:strand:- start:258 stop:1121 length:864 start_codon:yes stop_codon:yes gene_type:complete